MIDRTTLLKSTTVLIPYLMDIATILKGNNSVRDSFCLEKIGNSVFNGGSVASWRKRVRRYIRYFDYYLENFARRLAGKGLMNPSTNGEFNLMESIVKNCESRPCFLDGGSNVGEHTLKFNDLCREYGLFSPRIFVIEPFPSTIEVLKKNLADISYELIDQALGEEQGVVNFHSETLDCTGGQNSVIPHYYLGTISKVRQTTIDSIVKDYAIKKIDLLKLDIEGFEYKALLGARKALSEDIIDYIQLEYNQTWIEGGGSILKVMKLAEEYRFKLYRIRANDMLSIPSYNFNLDDFFYCNLLLVRDGCELPLISKRKANPLI